MNGGKIAFAIVLTFWNGSLAAQGFPGWYTFDTLTSPLPSNLITSLDVAPNRTVWMGTSSGLASLSEQLNWNLWDTANSPLTDNWIKTLHREASGTLWIGTLSGGLFGFNNGAWTHYHSGNAPWLTNNVGAVLRRANGDLWVGTHGQGVYVLANSAWQHLSPASIGLDLSYVNALAEDDSGCVWVATHNAGLLKFCSGGWTAYNTLNTNFNSLHVQTVAMGPDGRIWVGLSGSRPDSALHCLDRTTGTWTLFGATHTGGQGISQVWDLHFDQFQRLWIATNEITCGAWLYNDTVFTCLSAGYSGLAQNRVFAVRERQDTSYWFATLSGLSYFKPAFATSLETADTAVIHVGPIPCDMELVVASESSNPLRSLRIFHPSGNCVRQWQAMQSAQKVVLPLSDLKAGWYILEIKTSRSFAVRRILKV
ncbi:MAG: hypothetical protein NZM15_08740 [Flavobacteriales bacterium]|nr:hypothetical protein [Flavobacteriales bacterium]MDW8432774.1 two-component regulator propeller domain-containing protein [Flavobacteriales bacterium]